MMTDYTPTTEEVMGIYRWRKATEKYGVNAVYKKLDIEEAEFDRWLAEVIRKAKADGFDEGWDARVNAETITPTENPYRQGETE